MLWMMPAQERLEATDAVGIQVDDGLVRQPELAVLEGTGQICAKGLLEAELLWPCHGNESRSATRLVAQSDHAAALATCHWLAASDLNNRRVRREMR